MKPLHRGLEILMKYTPNGCTSAEHDVIYSDPQDKNLDEADLKELDELGWFWSEEVGCWAKFT